jgi:hypothetical protein
VIVMAEPIFERVEEDLLHPWKAFERHRHPGATMIAASVQAQPPEAPVSVITEIKAGLEDLVAKAEGIDEAAVSKLEAIAANPAATEVMDTLATVLHVPANGLTIAVNVLKELGSLWDKPAAAEAAAPAAADPSETASAQ